LRSLIALAATGSGPAQRFVFAMVDQIEQELAVAGAAAGRGVGRYPNYFA